MEERIAIFKRKNPAHLEKDTKTFEEERLLKNALEELRIGTFFDVAEKQKWNISAEFDTHSKLYGNLTIYLPEMVNPCVLIDGKEKRRLNEMTFYEGDKNEKVNPSTISSLEQRIFCRFWLNRDKLSLADNVLIDAEVFQQKHLFRNNGDSAYFSLSRFIANEEREIVKEVDSLGRLGKYVRPFQQDFTGPLGLDRFKSWRLEPFHGRLAQEQVYGALGEAKALFAKSAEGYEDYFVLMEGVLRGSR